MLETYYSFLENTFEWFFGSTILQDPFVALITKGLEYFLGLWLLYIFLAKPILMMFNYIDEYIYRGRL